MERSSINAKSTKCQPLAGIRGTRTEPAWEMRAKKLFLFAPERMALSMARLEHYCGTPAEAFHRYVLFTNYRMHVEEFRARFPDAEGPSGRVQMPAWHARAGDHDGISIVDIGVGPCEARCQVCFGT